MIFSCIFQSAKPNESSVLNENEYGYFRYKTAFYDGNFRIHSKLFQGSDKCFSDFDCNPKDLLTESGHLSPTQVSFPIKLDVGSYYAISKIWYVEASFLNCKESNLKIYHGFKFKEPFDPFQPLDLYQNDFCEWIGANQIVCPKIEITKKGIFEIELKSGATRSNQYSVRHWMAPFFLTPIAILYCALLSESVDFIDVKVNRYE
ncbi:hypothetical protein EHQ30_14935 [Leptospira brenneri]|uniref:Uncharacterized protein n=1 Tax=Leptospira brenneri TaxID=2023182 RepID=A0A5F1Z568_9LEPT|nr:hypothetical protein EHQ30_14935 [Leptospira brenneri]